MTDLPTLRDFSKESINKAVIKEALTHPAAMYPGVFAALCGLAGALFASPVLLVTAGGMAVAGVSSMVVNYCFRYDQVGRRYLENISRRMLQQRENLVNSLEPDLRRCKEIDDFCYEKECNQGLNQFSLAKEKYEEVLVILRKKLSEGELMFGRFMASIEQVYLGILDNLREMIGVIEGMPDAEGDPRELLRYLEKVQDENERRRVKAILKRFELRSAQLNKVAELLARNEEAITELESTIIVVSSMRTDPRLSDMDHEEAISQLKSIAERVSTLNNQSQI